MGGHLGNVVGAGEHGPPIVVAVADQTTVVDLMLDRIAVVRFAGADTTDVELTVMVGQSERTPIDKIAASASRSWNRAQIDRGAETPDST